MPQPRTRRILRRSLRVPPFPPGPHAATCPRPAKQAVVPTHAPTALPLACSSNHEHHRLSLSPPAMDPIPARNLAKRVRLRTHASSPSSQPISPSLPRRRSLRLIYIPSIPPRPARSTDPFPPCDSLTPVLCPAPRHPPPSTARSSLLLRGHSPQWTAARRWW